MKKKCCYCGVMSDCSVAGGFCSYSCKELYINSYKRELKRLQKELYNKYKI